MSFPKNLSVGSVETNIIVAFNRIIPPDVDIIVDFSSLKFSGTQFSTWPVLDGIMSEFKQKPVCIHQNRQLLNTRNKQQVMNNNPPVNYLAQEEGIEHTQGNALLYCVKFVTPPPITIILLATQNTKIVFILIACFNFRTTYFTTYYYYAIILAF